MSLGSAVDYPRDMVGYGPNPPHPQWPGGANIAVQFVLNGIKEAFHLPA